MIGLINHAKFAKKNSYIQHQTLPQCQATLMTPYPIPFHKSIPIIPKGSFWFDQRRFLARPLTWRPFVFAAVVYLLYLSLLVHH